MVTLYPLDKFYPADGTEIELQHYRLDGVERLYGKWYNSLLPEMAGALQQGKTSYIVSTSQVREFVWRKASVNSDAADAARYRWLKAGVFTRQGQRIAGGRELVNENKADLFFRFWCSEKELDALIDKEIK